MIVITNNEKQIIRERFPDIHIRRTVPQKSKRHRYYMEENRAAMRVLRAIRAARTR